MVPVIGLVRQRFIPVACAKGITSRIDLGRWPLRRVVLPLTERMFERVDIALSTRGDRVNSDVVS